MSPARHVTRGGIAALLLVLLPAAGWASGPKGKAVAPKAFDRCFETAAARYSIDPQMLRAIALTETGMRPHLVGPKNKNGTYDIGLMQINSAWLKTLARHGITEQGLFNACTNIQVGAWILANNIATHGARWKSVGAYNASTPSKQLIYIEKVKRNYALVMREAPSPEVEQQIEIKPERTEIVIYSES